jgi:hypothetical protein
MERRKVIKKIGICKCSYYREEIKELNDVIFHLKSQLKQYNQSDPEPEMYTLPNSFSEFNAQMEELEIKEFEIKDVSNYKEFEIKEFDINEFNKEFEAKKANQKWEEDPILFKINMSNEIEYKKNYNPNILPEKAVSGFEKFNLDEFNKQFEQQTNQNCEDLYENTSKVSNDTIEEVNYKKNYNPNILPQKVITGFEKFNNDEFNKQFEQQTTVNYNGI